MKNTIQLHKKWLKVSSIAIWSFAPIFFFGTISSTSEPARWTLDLLSWPLDGNMTYDAPATQFQSAVIGGVLFGWGLLVWLLSGSIYDKAPEEIRRIIVLSLCAWFFLDSLGSITSGNATNVFFNALLLILAVGPMWKRTTENS